MNLSSTHRYAPGNDLSTREARFGVRVGAVLTINAESLPHDITERLRHAREQALSRARASRTAQATKLATGTATQVVGGQAGATGLLGGVGFAWLGKATSLLPLVALVAGLMMIEELHDQAQIRAAAEVDAALLADDLPPDAYADPGFLEFLRSPLQ